MSKKQQGRSSARSSLWQRAKQPHISDNQRCISYISPPIDIWRLWYGWMGLNGASLRHTGRRGRGSLWAHGFIFFHVLGMFERSSSFFYTSLMHLRRPCHHLRSILLSNTDSSINNIYSFTKYWNYIISSMFFMLNIHYKCTDICTH